MTREAETLLVDVLVELLKFLKNANESGTKSR